MSSKNKIKIYHKDEIYAIIPYCEECGQELIIEEIIKYGKLCHSCAKALENETEEGESHDDV